MRMTPEFFEMIKTRLEPRLARQATNYRAPISVGEKLALTIRYLATVESYTSFRVMMTTIELPPETVRDVVMTCVVLHNILTSQYEGQHGGQQPGGENVPSDGRFIGGAADGGGDRNPAREVKRLRDYFKDYFNNEGAVAWQDGRI